MAVHAVDWDGTLVHADSQGWQDGALDVVRRWLVAGDRMIVHTCRANWPEGRQSIIDKLRDAQLDHPNVTVEGKPLADDYVDNLAVRHSGDWAQTEADVQAGRSVKPTATVQAVAFRTGFATAPIQATARPTFARRA